MQKLKDTLLQLKNAKFISEPYRNKERLQRHMQFNETNGLQNVQKKRPSTQREGIFRGIVFCFPRHHPTLHPPPDKMFNLAKGIESQGGKLIDLESDLLLPTVDYVLADRRADVWSLKKKLVDKIIYVEVIDYKWVQDSLRRFSLQDMSQYKLQELKRPYSEGQLPSPSKATTKTMNDTLQEIRAKGKDDTSQREDSQEGTAEMDEFEAGQESEDSIVVTQPSDMLSDREESVDSGDTQKMDSQQQNPPDKRASDDPETVDSKRNKIKPTLGSHKFAINNEICAKLQQMQKIYQQKKDLKSYAYLRAIAAIRNLNKPIKSANQLWNIEGIGRKTIQKVEQFLKTGSISRVDKRVDIQKKDPYHQLLRISGIGPTTAQELYHKGIRSIEQLKQHPQMLNRVQSIGLKYMEQFQQRISRQKVGRMLEYVKQTWYFLVRSDTRHYIEAVGSYRRGRPTCGDIDILITRRDGKYQRGMLARLVSELEARGFLTDHINQPRPEYDDRHSVQYMGVCKFEEPHHHRIDIKYYPRSQYAFALLYFTGSHLFNRQMRLAANKQGLMLGDHSLRRVERKKTVPKRNGEPPACFTQRDIFNVLDMPYRSPQERQL